MDPFIDIKTISKLEYYPKDTNNFYKGNPFTFNKDLKPNFDIPNTVLKDILQFKYIDKKYLSIKESILRNPVEYGIDEKLFEELKEKYYIEEEYLEDSSDSLTIIKEIENDTGYDTNDTTEYYEYKNKDYKSKDYKTEDYKTEDKTEDKSDDEYDYKEYKNLTSNLYTQDNDSVHSLPIIKDSKVEHSKLEEYSEVKILSEDFEKREMKKVKERKLQELINLIQGKDDFLTDIYKKNEILSYIKNKTKKDLFSLEDLDELSPEDIDKLWELIQHIKNKSKIDLSYILIKLLMFIIEKIALAFKFTELNGLCRNLTYDVMKRDIYSTHKFLNDKINCPNLPFGDIIYYILKTIFPIWL